MNPFGSSKNVMAQNVLATSADRERRLELYYKKRMCWKCQQDKPVRFGKLTKFTKGFGPFSRSADKFICGDCLPKKEEA